MKYLSLLTLCSLLVLIPSCGRNQCGSRCCPTTTTCTTTETTTVVTETTPQEQQAAVTGADKEVLEEELEEVMSNK